MTRLFPLFRVWDLKKKKLLDPSCFAILGTGKLIVAESGYYNHFTNVNAEDYLIDRYTGLTDSKGTPIYEGDIIRDTWKENRPYSYSPDEEYDCNEVFEVIYKDYSFNLERKYSREQTCVDDFHREIIGNIFETHNLLK